MRYTSRVIRGRGEGRRIGFPTLNFEVPEGISEKHGIYAGWLFLKEDRMPAVFHFGPIPTFEIQTVSLEAHALEELREPPEEIPFELSYFLRPVENFSELKDLQAAINEDIRSAKDILGWDSLHEINEEWPR